MNSAGKINLSDPKQKRAGVLAPLFCLYSRKVSGSGDCADLKLFRGGASLSGNSIVQLLPMNEVGSLFCPYDSLSSFALEPAYIFLTNHKKKAPAVKTYVNYAVKQEKIKLLQDMYLESGRNNSAELEAFKQENEYWLGGFGVYKVI